MTARQRTLHIFLIPFFVACAASAQTTNSTALPAAAKKVVTLRMLDWRTGHLISTDQFLVQVNRKQDEHADWVTLNDDGSGHLTLPSDATQILIHGKYDSAMSLYVNCDSEKKTKIPEFNVPGDEHWYSVDDILKSGVVTHNGCGRGKDDPKFAAKPGEFVFFVRKQSWREEEKY